MTAAGTTASLLFVTAPAPVQRTALARRDVDPCGDALSLSQMVTTSTLTARDVEAPVLLLFGGRDALNRDGAAGQQRQAYSSSVAVTSHTVKGAGSALPLERSAPTDPRPGARLAVPPPGLTGLRPRPSG